MQERYRHDCLFPFFYASVEVEAFGAEVLFAEDGPPNAGEPFLRKPEQINRLEPPKIEDAACLRKGAVRHRGVEAAGG
jgi:uroporphyrinogen decarboxylase